MALWPCPDAMAFNAVHSVTDLVALQQRRLVRPVLNPGQKKKQRERRQKAATEVPESTASSSADASAPPPGDLLALTDLQPRTFCINHHGSCCKVPNHPRGSRTAAALGLSAPGSETPFGVFACKCCEGTCWSCAADASRGRPVLALQPPPSQQAMEDVPHSSAAVSSAQSAPVLIARELYVREHVLGRRELRDVPCARVRRHLCPSRRRKCERLTSRGRLRVRLRPRVHRGRVLPTWSDGRGEFCPGFPREHGSGVFPPPHLAGPGGAGADALSAEAPPWPLPLMPLRSLPIRADVGDQAAGECLREGCPPSGAGHSA